MEQKSTIPIISVVIPVKNGAGTIRPCLEGIFSQTVADKLEVIIIDSGSTDGTLQILQEFPVNVINISPESFNHGLTRNIGAGVANGEIIVFTVQDAIASDPRWLETLTGHFSDPEIAGVCGQQAVDHHPAQNPLQWFRPTGPSETRRVKDLDFRSLSPRVQYELCRWDNVNAAYRSTALFEIPFRQTSFGEDALWAKDALEAGKSLVYDYRARVWHYHHQSFSFYFRRSYIIFYMDFRNFNYLQPGQSFLSIVPRIMVNVFRMPLPLKQKKYWSWYNLNLALAKLLAKMTFRALKFIEGENGVDWGLKVICQVIPQGRQRN